jgi:hypothetical protein
MVRELVYGFSNHEPFYISEFIPNSMLLQLTNYIATSIMQINSKLVNISVPVVLTIK